MAFLYILTLQMCSLLLASGCFPRGYHNVDSNLGLVGLVTPDIWDQVTLCCGGRPAPHRMFSSILASTHWVPIAPSPVATTKTVSDTASVPWVVETPVLRICGCKDGLPGDEDLGGCLPVAGASRFIFSLPNKRLKY